MWRKAWESITGRLGNASVGERRGDTEEGEGMGLGPEMERLPREVVAKIVQRAGPRGTAAMHCPNRSWRHLVSSDNSLWIHFLRAHSSDSLFFVETHLRSGPSLLPSFPASDAASLSFMCVYAQHAQVPDSFILDGGSGYCKFWWNKYAAPSAQAREVTTELVNCLVVVRFLGKQISSGREWVPGGSCSRKVGIAGEKG